MSHSCKNSKEESQQRFFSHARRLYSIFLTLARGSGGRERAGKANHDDLLARASLGEVDVVTNAELEVQLTRNERQSANY